MKIYLYQIPTFIICFTWMISLIIAPMTLPPNSVKDLSGRVGVKDNENITSKMNPFARFVYESGDSNCHQLKSRSLFINGNQMPYCTRCFGIFLGLAVGTFVPLFRRYEFNIMYYLLALIPIGIDGTGQIIGLWESTNPIRLVTGFIAGAASGLAIGYFIGELYELYIYYKVKRRAEKKRTETTGASGTHIYKNEVREEE